MSKCHILMNDCSTPINYKCQLPQSLLGLICRSGLMKVIAGGFLLQMEPTIVFGFAKSDPGRSEERV